MAVMPVCLGGMLGALICWAWGRPWFGRLEGDPALVERLAGWGAVLLAVAARLVSLAGWPR
jgi:hypothetical protein